MMLRRRPRYVAAAVAATFTAAAGAAEIAGSSHTRQSVVVFVLAIAAGAAAGALITWIGRRRIGGTTTADGKWRWFALIGPLSVPFWGHALGASGGAGFVGALGSFLTVMFFAAAADAKAKAA
jgi:hypothetical protein